MRILFIACSALLLASCAKTTIKTTPIETLTAEQDFKQSPEIIPVKQVLRPQDVLDLVFHIASTSSEAYQIQAGDHVEVSFLTAPELSGPRVVLPDGTINLPYAGNIQISGMSVVDAQNAIIKKYKPILRQAEITLSVSSPLAQQEALRASLSNPSSGLGREIVVAADGRASFPLIGSLSLQGKSIEELGTELNALYAEKSPQLSVDVLLKSTNANQVFVLGEVRQPGAYPVQRAISALEALSLASGTLNTARLDSVVIMRRQGDHVETHIYNLKEALNGKASEFAYLQPDDLIFIPRTRLSKAAEISRQIADVILFQGVGFSFSYRVDDKDDQNTRN